VCLAKFNGIATLIYQNEECNLSDGDFVFFDDSIHHSWVMKDCDLEILYYRQCGDITNPVTVGDYCLDDFFGS